MKSLKMVTTSLVVMAIVAFAISSTGVTNAFAADTGTPVEQEGSETYGTLFYIGLGAVAVIGGFAIWQNIKDSKAKEAALSAESAEDVEIENFDEYFGNIKESETVEDSDVIEEETTELTTLTNEGNEK